MKKLALILGLIVLTALGGSLAPFDWLIVDNLAADSFTPAACYSAGCVAEEEAILGSTVRIHLQFWRVKERERGYWLDESIGHATLREGRYLITHNHYALLKEAGSPPGAISVALYDARGRFLFAAPLSDYDVSWAEGETRVFEMKYPYMQARLAAAGISSATFAVWQSLDLKAGQKVAQIDWDGQVSRVDWTTIESIVTGDGATHLLLSDGVEVGGSGGGVFWNGIHIGNNWQAVDHVDEAGNIVRVTSVAYLNDF